MFPTTLMVAPGGWGQEIETVAGPIQLRLTDKYIEVLIVASNIEGRYPCEAAFEDGETLAVELCAGTCHIRRDDMPEISLLGLAGISELDLIASAMGMSNEFDPLEDFFGGETSGLRGNFFPRRFGSAPHENDEDLLAAIFGSGLIFTRGGIGFPSGKRTLHFGERENPQNRQTPFE